MGATKCNNPLPAFPAPRLTAYQVAFLAACEAAGHAIDLPADRTPDQDAQILRLIRLGLLGARIDYVQISPIGAPDRRITGAGITNPGRAALKAAA